MDTPACLRVLQIASLAWLLGLWLAQRHAHTLFHQSEHGQRLQQAARRWLVAVCLLQWLRVAVHAWSLQALLGESMSWISVLQTHVAQVLLAQAVLLSLAMLWFLWRGMHRVVVGGLLLAMAGMAFSGHVVSSSEDRVLSLVSVLHVLLAQLWLASLMGLWHAAGQGDVLHLTWRARLAQLSRWALPGMGVLLFTGVMISRWSVATWPGLLATTYGWVLLFKLCLVAAALTGAWRLRRWLRDSTAAHAWAKTWLSAELAAALGVVIGASWLAATVPAAHDAIEWPFAFRWAPVIAWKQDPTPTLQALLAAAALCLLGGGLWLWLRRRHRPLARGLGVGAGLLALAVALPATTIPAYPTTYMHSSARLDADSVMAGQALYQRLCTDCHGLHGMGDGPLAKQHRLPAANLTEPHVSWHTHGDMFWWLSHGRGAMPGFASVTSVDERWHLINHLIALSLGHESRSISDRPAPFNPWLPSIDFRFQMDNNNFMSLSEWRGLHPVHLIIVNQENELQRVRDLLKDMNGFPAQLVVVSKPAWLKDLVKGPCEAVLVPDTDGVIAKAWSHYRRSFAAPDFQNEETEVARIEFLIDRYGFVRARWRSDETPNALSLRELQGVYDSLSAEGPIKSAAIHQHD